MCAGLILSIQACTESESPPEPSTTTATTTAPAAGDVVIMLSAEREITEWDKGRCRATHVEFGAVEPGVGEYKRVARFEKAGVDLCIPGFPEGSNGVSVAGLPYSPDLSEVAASSRGGVGYLDRSGVYTEIDNDSRFRDGRSETILVRSPWFDREGNFYYLITDLSRSRSEVHQVDIASGANTVIADDVVGAYLDRDGRLLDRRSGTACVTGGLGWLGGTQKIESGGQGLYLWAPDSIIDSGLCRLPLNLTGYRVFNNGPDGGQISSAAGNQAGNQIAFTTRINAETKLDIIEPIPNTETTPTPVWTYQGPDLMRVVEWR